LHLNLAREQRALTRAPAPGTKFERHRPCSPSWNTADYAEQPAISTQLTSTCTTALGIVAVSAQIDYADIGIDRRDRFSKKGTKSAGVARQYSGTAGRIENSQVGVFAAYAAPRGRGLIDRELYIPKDWFTDRDRCRAAGFPDEVEFATKPDLGQRMIARALTAGLPFKWVAADEAYGEVGRLRLWLEEHNLAHVLAVPKSQMVIAMDLRQRRAHAVIADLRSARPGRPSPRRYSARRTAAGASNVSPGHGARTERCGRTAAGPSAWERWT
jgi:hypothetical protein